MLSVKKTSVLAGTLAALALALAGCGGSSRSAASVTGQTGSNGGSAAQTAATSGTGPSSTTSTTGTTSTTASPAKTSSACTASDLTPDFIGSDAATGHVVLAFGLHNTSSAACHTYGYPGVQFRASGNPIATDAQRVTQDFAGSVPLVQITLQPGQWASFRMITNDVSSNACQSADSVQIIAPDDTATMSVSLPNAVSVCGGKATVSPLQPGLRANPGGNANGGGSSSAGGGNSSGGAAP
ncbi:MAG TPA: DUF4232 domain-containing protein [Solirubrobacteraceae bacterium]|nr:DUF4232 domain-containing protein [Solirubrobacteraceae bacterium]